MIKTAVSQKDESKVSDIYDQKHDRALDAASTSKGDRKFTVEIKAVNHRYFDVNIKMPKKFNFFESAIRSVMKEYIQRGKVDVFITCEDDTENNFSLKYNENIAGEYLKYYRQMAQQFNLKDDVTVSRLGSCPEVLFHGGTDGG